MLARQLFQWLNLLFIFHSLIHFSIQMKQFRLHRISMIVASTILLFLFSCKKDSGDSEKSPDNHTGATLLDAILALGFDPDKIEDKGSYYIANGDVAFFKADSALYLQPKRESSYGRTQQQRMANLINFYTGPDPVNSNIWRRRSATYYIDPSLRVIGPDFWYDAILSAVSEWSNVTQCGVYMIYVENQADADITLTSDASLSTPLDNGLIALASETLPSGDPGPTIHINLDAVSNSTWTPEQKKYIMVHEFGHCLGLFHTDQLQAGTTIPGTPTNDGNSVMNSGGGTVKSWSSFSAGDLLAIRTLYPHPRKETISPLYSTSEAPFSGYQTIQWNASAFTGTVKIELYDVYFDLPNGGHRFEFRRLISSAAANTGSFPNGINYSTDTCEGAGVAMMIKITSNTTGLYAISPFFYLFWDN